MSDDSNTSGSKPDSGARPAGHDDLKARLGLNIPERKPTPAAPVAESPRETPPVQSFAPKAAVEPVEMGVEGRERKMSGGMIALLIGIGVAALVLGTFVGDLFKGRAIINHQIDEATHLLEYFTTEQVAAAGGGLILDAVNKHVEDTRRVFDMMNKADPNDPEQVSKARAELDAYIKRAQKYFETQPFFTVDQALYGVVFNPDVSFEVVKFIDAVRNLYDETSLLAYEGATLDQVSALENKGSSAKSIMFIKPVTKDNGERWNSGTWVNFMAGNPSEKTADGTDYGVKDIVSGEDFRASTTALVEFDMGPVAMLESEVYKQSIFLRVKARVGNVVKAADEVDFSTLETKLKEMSGRSRLFSFF